MARWLILYDGSASCAAPRTGVASSMAANPPALMNDMTAYGRVDFRALLVGMRPPMVWDRSQEWEQDSGEPSSTSPPCP